MVPAVPVLQVPGVCDDPYWFVTKNVFAQVGVQCLTVLSIGGSLVRRVSDHDLWWRFNDSTRERAANARIVRHKVSMVFTC